MFELPGLRANLELCTKMSDRIISLDSRNAMFCTISVIAAVAAGVLAFFHVCMKDDVDEVRDKTTRLASDLNSTVNKVNGHLINIKNFMDKSKDDMSKVTKDVSSLQETVCKMQAKMCAASE